MSGMPPGIVEVEPADEHEDRIVPVGLDPNRAVVYLEGDEETMAQAVIAAYPNDPPTLFRRGSELVRILDLDGRRVLDPLDRAGLRVHLNRTHQGVRTSEKNGHLQHRQVSFPPTLLDHLLRYPWDLPQLIGIYEWPVLSPEKGLIEQTGYHPDIQAWVERPAGLPNWSGRRPRQAEVEHAIDILLGPRGLLGGFPFVDAASKAHALAWALGPIVRPAINGPTPIHVFSATAPRTGKTLLSRVLTIIVTGAEPALLSPPKWDDAEIEKRLVALLMRGSPCAILDNVPGSLDSPSLAAITTADTYSGRILGQSRMVHLPVRMSLALTINGPNLTTELAGRSIACLLDAGVERPQDRHFDRNLELDARRDRLIFLDALLVLVRHWLAEGQPMPPIEAQLGSHWAWSRTMGGIFGAAGIEGFLENRHRFYDLADAEATEWEAFVTAWYARHGQLSVRPCELWPILEDIDGIGWIRAKGERAGVPALTKALKARAGRVVAGLRIVRERNTHTKNFQYRLKPTAADVSAGDGDEGELF